MSTNTPQLPSDSTSDLPSDAPGDDAEWDALLARRSRTTRIVAIVVGVVVFIGTWIGVSALLNALDAPAAVSTAVDGGAGVAYESQEYGFTARFPSEPVETTQNQAVLAYEIEILTVQWVSESTLFSLNAAILPEEIVTAQELDVLLENSIGGVATATGATLTGQEFTELDGERAIAALISYPTGISGKVFVVLNGTTQFSLMVTGDESEWQPFVDSFAFTR